MRINFPALFALKIEHRHTASASQSLSHRAPRYPAGVVAKRIREINNGTFLKADSTRSRDTNPNIGVRERMQPPLIVSNERDDQTQLREVTTQPMRRYAGAPVPQRSEFHPLVLWSVLHVSSSNGNEPLELPDMAQFASHDSTGGDGVDGAEAPVDNHRQAGSAADTGYVSDWGSDFDSDGDDEDDLPRLHSPEYFSDLERRLTAALPFLKVKPASDKSLMLSSLQPRSESDNGYGSSPDSPDVSASTEQPTDAFGSLRRDFFFHKEALEAFDTLPDDVKQDGSATLPGMDQGPEYRSVTTFADLIKHGRETLKKRTSSIQPPPPQSTAKPDILSEIQNFNRTTLKPVNTSVPQTKQAGIARVDDVPHTVSTHDALLRVMREMSPPDQD